MSKTRSNSFNTGINIISSVGVLVINLCISFFLSPYIVRTIGVEANGFVTLANNFVAYADLVVTALNAMAARFITIAYVKKDFRKANLYYNSVFWGNLIIVAGLLVPAAVLIVKLQIFVDVPADILLDVKILFSLIFFAFFARTAAPNWDCGTYVTNRMDLSNIPSIIAALIRCVSLICVFSVWVPHVWYIGLISAVMTLFTLAVAWFNTHRLTPELKVNLKKPICSVRVIIELVGSGIWNSISVAGNTLLSGLDLILCNVYLGSTMMGVLSLSKTLPNILIQLSESIRGAFGPELTICYAKGDGNSVLRCIRRAMKITAVVVTIPTAGIIVMSDIFFSLWVPSQDAKLLQVLSTLAVMSYLLNSGVVILFNVFTTVNKVRYNSIAMIVSGIVSVLTTLALILFSDYDLYAVAGVSSVVTICKNLFFTIPAASRLLGFKWYQFYPQVGISALCSCLIIVVGVVVRMLIPVNSWQMFFVAVSLIGVIGLVMNVMIVLNKEERAFLIGLVRKKIRKQ